VLTFTVEGLFIGVNGTSTDLERSIWCRVERPPPTQASLPRVDVWQQRLELNHLKP
jgi:hypothetical protein